MRVVVLMSGGLDSSLMAYMYKKGGHEVYPLHIDYGQLCEPREWAALKKVGAELGLRTPHRIDIHGFGESIPSGITSRSLRIYEEAFLPGRNLLFILLGSSYAFSKGIRAVAIGILANPLFPDCTAEFLASAKSAISRALGTEIEILAPLIEVDKRAVVRSIRKHRLPEQLMYFCHAGEQKPCGVCVSCREHDAALEALGADVQDVRKDDSRD